MVLWLEKACPQVADLTVEDVRDYRTQMERDGKAPWTVYHHLTVLRILLDQAMRLGWADDNPARQVSLKQPKRVKDKRILTPEEVQWCLDTSLQYRQWINGAVPTVVRLGLYAGLRNEEMCWLKWKHIDWHHRILTIQQTTDPATKQTWKPKPCELRRIDIKQGAIDYLAAVRERQAEKGLVSEFVIPGGGNQSDCARTFLGRPISREQPQKGFGRMLDAERSEGRPVPEGVTVYSFRHTYCTSLLRKPPQGAGLDLRTVMACMGHSSLRVTEGYLNYTEPEEHPSDALPY